MIDPIKNETTLLDAFRIDVEKPWWVQQSEFRDLSFGKKLQQLVGDYAVKLFAKVLGVKIENINQKDLRQKYDDYTHEKSHGNYHNERVVLVLHIEDAIASDPIHFKELERQSECRVVFRRVCSLKDATEEMGRLKNNGCKIEALWIRAHGTPTTLTFPSFLGGEVLDVSSLDHSLDKFTYDNAIQKATDFCEAIDQNVEKQSPIILESCFTGKPMPDGRDNIASFISRVAQRKVFAPRRETLNIEDGVSYSKDKGFTAVLKSHQADRYFRGGSLLARLSAVWLAFRQVEEDITKVFFPGCTY